MASWSELEFSFSKPEGLLLGSSNQYGLMIPNLAIIRIEIRLGLES